MEIAWLCDLCLCCGFDDAQYIFKKYLWLHAVFTPMYTSSSFAAFSLLMIHSITILATSAQDLGRPPQQPS